jgi:hypothetical protein
MSAMEKDNTNGPAPVSEYIVIDEPDEGRRVPPPDDDRSWAWLASCYPVLVTLAYLFIGFVLKWWHPTWLLFLTIPIFYAYYAAYKKK